MMTKTKSGKSALLKYLTVFPLLVLAMLLFANREALAQASALDQPVVVVGIQETTPESNVQVASKGPAELIISNSENEPQPLYFIDGKEAAQADVAALNPNDLAKVDVLKGEAAIKAKGSRAAHGAVLITTKKDQGEVDEMPRFPGCEEMEDKAARVDCAKKKLSEFIVANLTYPQSARDANLEGYVVTSFVVNADGSIGKTEIITKSFCKACEEEVQRVIDMMPKWVPAQKNGKAVAAEVKLPIKFAQDAKFSDSPVAGGGDEIFKVVEEMPRFPGEGCENSDLEQAAKKQCADRAMLEFIYKGIKYPKAARDAGIEGTAVVSFVVDKSGKIRDAKIVRSIGGGCDEEVLRLVGEMPDWIPGKQRGRLVNVQMNLPIKFKLDTSEAKAGENTKPQSPPVVPAQEKEWKPTNFSASPNPASNQVRVYFESDKKSIYVCVTDAANKLIFDENVKGFDGVYDKTFNLAGVPKGVVKILVIEEGNKIYFHNLVVQ